MSTTPHDTTCKLCHQPLVVYLDQDYSQTNDINKLLPMACHNACHDNMLKRERATHAIFKICRSLAERKCSTEQISKSRINLAICTRKLAEAAAFFFNSNNPLWTSDFPDSLLNSPHKAGSTLFHYAEHCRQHFSGNPPKNP